MIYPDWIIKISEIGGVVGLLAMLLAILYVAALLNRFQKAGRNSAILATLALGLAGAFGAAFGLILMVGEAHNDHQSNGAAIGWMMMIGYPALALAGPVALIVWAAALFSGAKAARRPAKRAVPTARQARPRNAGDVFAIAPSFTTAEKPLETESTRPLSERDSQVSNWPRADGVSRRDRIGHSALH